MRILAVFALMFSLLAGAMVVAAPPAEAGMKSKRVAILKKTNQQRAAHGCRPLKLRKPLNIAAQRHAKDMARKRYFSHTSLNGTLWWKRIIQAGWKNPAGENIARGYTTARSVVRAWMNSPGHRRNILNCSFRYLGVGYKEMYGTKYWVQDFGY